MFLCASLWELNEIYTRAWQCFINARMRASVENMQRNLWRTQTVPRCMCLLYLWWQLQCARIECIRTHWTHIQKYACLFCRAVLFTEKHRKTVRKATEKATEKQPKNTKYRKTLNIVNVALCMTYWNKTKTIPTSFLRAPCTVSNHGAFWILKDPRIPILADLQCIKSANGDCF